MSFYQPGTAKVEESMGSHRPPAHFPGRKRLFDLVVALVTAPLWLTAVGVSALAVWLREGAPVFYVSSRRVHLDRSERIVKLRAMVRDAERIANRATVKVKDTRFLNIPPDSALYTPVGRILERCHFTELPQFFHVLRGQMSVIGCRPLPENVIDCLRERYPAAEDRFLSRAGMTGPTQLVGKDNISDADRLRLEIDYAMRCMFSYSVLLDVAILAMTVFVASGLRRKGFTPAEVHKLMARFGQRRIAPRRSGADESRAYQRYLTRDRLVSLEIGENQLRAHVQDLSYDGARLALISRSALASQTPVVLASGDTWVPARVQWSRQEGNATTLGVVFERSGVRGSDLVALLNGGSGHVSCPKEAVRTPLAMPSR